MPGPTTWVVVAAVGALALMLWRMSVRQRRMLRLLDDLHRTARHDAETEREVERLLAQSPEEKAKRRLRVLPPAALAALLLLGAWLRANWAAVTGTTVAAAGMGVLLTLTPAEQWAADPPAPRPPAETRAPSHTTPLPTAATSTTTTPRPVEPATTEPLRPPTATLTTTHTSTGPPSTTTEPPPVSVSPSLPPVPMDECVVEVEVGELLGVCLPPVHR